MAKNEAKMEALRARFNEVILKESNGLTAIEVVEVLSRVSVGWLNMDPGGRDAEYAARKCHELVDRAANLEPA